ncbi:MAG: hypothetical protein Q4G43_17815, partial [Mobilicoccus sp.]|nr:hypothetical protein [Mobilicoccus sp.]
MRMIDGLAGIAHRWWSAGADMVGQAMERLSTGLRINRAADDAAGLAISQGLTARINGFDQGVRNAQDGVSLLQTAEGGLSTMHEVLQRMRTLAVQASNGIYGTVERNAMQSEMNELISELDRTASRTQFNGFAVLDGTFEARSVQLGPEARDAVTVTIDAFDTTGLGLRGNGTPGPVAPPVPSPAPADTPPPDPAPVDPPPV